MRWAVSAFAPNVQMRRRAKQTRTTRLNELQRLSRPCAAKCVTRACGGLLSIAFHAACRPRPAPSSRRSPFTRLRIWAGGIAANSCNGARRASACSGTLHLRQCFAARAMCAAARIASILLSSQITTDTFLAFLTQLLFAVTRSALESALSTAFANKKST